MTLIEKRKRERREREEKQRRKYYGMMTEGKNNEVLKADQIRILFELSA